MNPQDAQQARQHALQEVTLALARFSSAELRPGYGGQLDAAILDYQQRIASIEQAEARATQQRYEETQLQTQWNRDQAGRFQPGAQPLNRGEGDPRPVPANEEEAVQQVMSEMAARGLGRI